MEKFHQESELANQTKWDDIRFTRSRLLVEADNLVNQALDKGCDVTEIRHYRQSLRDIPQTYDNPDDVVWPEKPTV